MATQGITDSMRAHADVLLSRSHLWSRGVRHRDGLAFVLFTSSVSGSDGQAVVYRTTETACTCRGYLYRGICAHVVAVRDEAERAREKVTRKVSYDELMDRQLGERRRELVDAF